MRPLCFICALVLPITACAQDAVEPQSQKTSQIEAPQTDTPLNAIWAQTARAKILERDYREFLTLLPGLYDNQEQVYFEDNLDVPQDQRHRRESYTVTMSDNGTIKIPDSRLSFATPTVSFKSQNGSRVTATIKPVSSGIEMSFPEDCRFIINRMNVQFSGPGLGACAGETLSLSSKALFLPNSISNIISGDFRRARLFKCWVSPRKEDGSYGFYNNVMLHDQGGHAWLEGEDHPRIGLKMRNVAWPTGKNRPSLVLYAYQGDDENKAVSYAWTSPDGTRLAMNLRWVQASCTLLDNK